MPAKKIIAVLGATGAQGGGLAHAILADKDSEFSVRAITRDADSDKAKELAAMGAEIVVADIDDKESLAKAFDGAYGAFCVTFFWAHYSAEKEMAEAKIMAEAAKEAGVQHVIWSTLEDVREWVPLTDNSMPTLHGKYKVPHFDGKGASDHFFTDAAVPTTFLLTAFYWDNLIYFGMGPKKDANGKLAVSLPMGDKKMSGISSEDIGKCAYGIFKKGKELFGKKVGIAGEHLSGAEMAQALSAALGKEVIYNEMTPDQYRSLGFPGADDLGNMFQFYRDFSDYFIKARDLKFAKELNPGLQSFSEWLRKNAVRIPME